MSAFTGDHDLVSSSHQPSLAEAVRTIGILNAQLAEHEGAAAIETNRLRSLIAEQKIILERTATGLDLDKIALAETVIYATTYDNGGEDRDSVVRDAIKKIAAGIPMGEEYCNLRTHSFGTKNYDRWQGQRSNHPYGMGPRHGWLCFQVGLWPDARDRDLTEAECDACIYYLLNLREIQHSKVSA